MSILSVTRKRSTEGRCCEEYRATGDCGGLMPFTRIVLTCSVLPASRRTVAQKNPHNQVGQTDQPHCYGPTGRVSEVE